MAITKRGEHYYGDTQADLRQEAARYAELNGYPAHQFADAVCVCGGRVFRLAVDDVEGAAVRTCTACAEAQPICDSAEYLQDASIEECACPCRGETFEITIAVSLYTGSDDVRWLYLGARCIACGLTAVYGDWKNEFEGYRELLSRV
jgi:hypothetical protein